MKTEQPTFEDAILIAKGCLDYGGGYRRSDRDLGIFHHGIQTVINALEGHLEQPNTQTNALMRIGAIANPVIQGDSK